MQECETVDLNDREKIVQGVSITATNFVYIKMLFDSQ